MAFDYDDQDQLEESVFPVKFDEKSELDRFGVWIKQKPEKNDQDSDKRELENIKTDEDSEAFVIDDTDNDDVISIDDYEDVIEFDDIEEFTQIPDMDIPESEAPLEKDEDLNTVMDEPIADSEETVAETVAEEKEETEKNMDLDDFETVDLDDLFNGSDIEDEQETKEEEDIAVTEEVDEVAPVEVSPDKENLTESSSVSTSDEIEETSEFDDLLSDLSSDSPAPTPVVEDDNGEIDMNITIDEDSDISSIAGKGSSDNESLDNISIFEDAPKAEEKEAEKIEEKKDDDDDDGLIIESTIIEADNMDAIREENEKILNQSSETPEVEDKGELDALDSMLDDLMGTESTSTSATSTSENTETVSFDNDDEPEFELGDFELNDDELSSTEDNLDDAINFDDQINAAEEFTLDEFDSSDGLNIAEDFNIEEDASVSEDIALEPEVDLGDDIDFNTDSVLEEDAGSTSEEVDLDLPENIEIEDNAEHDDNSIYFDDVEALQNDMLDDDLTVDEDIVSDSDVQDIENNEDEELPSNIEDDIEIENNIEEAIPSQEVAPQIENIEKTETVEAPQVQATAMQNDKATEILMQIAGELSSIKTELANLKTEMAMKADIPQVATINEEMIEAPRMRAEKAFEEASENLEESSGFFSDDDSDETIALTGDELNNILITADFTEQSADEEDAIPQNLSSDMDSSSIVEDDSDDEFEIPNVLDESMTVSSEDESNELIDNVDIVDVLPSEGIPTESIDPIDDDISYLEKDDEIIDDKPEDYIDIPDFNDEEEIEEPNLENFDLTIKELELPNGQSITLGQPDENINAIDNDDFESMSFDEGLIDDDTDTEEIAPNLSDEEEIFDANELDSATEDIPHLDLETNTAEQHKLDVPESVEESEVPSPEKITPLAKNFSEATEAESSSKQETLPIHLKEEIKSVLSYMDQLLESLPENKIEEFAKSEYFDTYKRLFDELGIS